jgi:hypothetical protein
MRSGILVMLPPQQSLPQLQNLENLGLGILALKLFVRLVSLRIHFCLASNTTIRFHPAGPIMTRPTLSLVFV